MDTYVFSLMTIFATMYFHYAASTPPAAAAKKELAGLKWDQRAMLVSRYIAHTLNIPVYLHFATEVYGIYSKGVSNSISPAICPPKTSNVTSVYQPRGELPPTIFLACLLIIVGGTIRVSCYQYLGRMFRWEVSIQDGHKLITSGPYAVVRHPSYTGTSLVNIGHDILVLAKGTILRECIVPSYGPWVRWIIWILVTFRTVMPFVLTWRTQSEDRLLKKEFGKEWEAWAARTRFRIIPFVF